jgi:hypothetical protein
MSVVVQLRGGLGNQLFQYAAGYSLSSRLHADLKLDTALLPPSTIDRGGVRRWPEQISSFTHSGTLFDSTGGSLVRKRVAQSVGGFERSLGDSPLRGVLGSKLYAREVDDDVTAFSRLGADSRINAYCNSSRFFADRAPEIVEQVTTLAAPGDWFIATSAELSADQPVALHVRWGDYLNLTHVYGTMGADYYRRALAAVVRSVGERPVWLFSDDPDGAAAFLGRELTIDRVVKPDAASSALENLVLLSRARAIVAANSSFSWWAAFLSNAESGAVVFPRPLFAAGGPAEPKDWLAADWIQVGRD